MRYITWKLSQHNSWDTKAQIQSTAAAAHHSPHAFAPFLNTHLINHTLNLDLQWSPLPTHTHSQSTDTLWPPTLPLTIVSVCCSLYLMHAGPSQSGHGCPERQVCDLTTFGTLVLFWLKFGCQFGEGDKTSKLFSYRSEAWIRLFSSTNSLKLCIFPGCSTHL